MEINKGLTGVLTATGKFIKCAYGQHGEVINKLTGYQNVLMLSVLPGNYGSYVIGDSCIHCELTKEQQDWFVNNEQYLTRLQRDMFKVLIRKGVV